MITPSLCPFAHKVCLSFHKLFVRLTGPSLPVVRFVYFAGDRWRTFGPQWRTRSQIDLTMIHGRHSERTLLNAGHTGCEESKPWQKANIYGVFQSVCVCVWWTLTTGGLVFIILPASTLMAGSPSPLRSSRLILILTACVTCRTHVCFPFIYSTFLLHSLADSLLLETAFYHAIARWKYYLRNADYFEFPREERCKQCTLQMCWLRWIYCCSGIWLLTHSTIRETFWKEKKRKIITQGPLVIPAASHEPHSFMKW